MKRASRTIWALAFLTLCSMGCGDTFNEGGAKPFGEGIKILEIKEGSGDPVKDGDRIEVHYRGWLKDNQKLFDDSYERGQPLAVRTGNGDLIRGFDMGLVGLKEGGIRRIFIPGRLGYGSAGSGRDIPPNSDLVFQVELVKVVERAASVKITDLKEGIGPEIKNGDRVQVHYTGTLTDGTKFDSSLDRGEPFGLTVGRGEVIKGWDIGLLGAKMGGKRKLEIPAHLAYGDRGQGKIPPNSPLVFEIEVVSVNPGKD